MDLFIIAVYILAPSDTKNMYADYHMLNFNILFLIFDTESLFLRF